jgi:hypothetical protein
VVWVVVGGAPGSLMADIRLPKVPEHVPASTAPVWSNSSAVAAFRCQKVVRDDDRMALADDCAAELEDSQVQVAAAFVAGSAGGGSEPASMGD